MDISKEIKIIKEWYEFKDQMCFEYEDNCKKCPLYESTDVWHGLDLDNCKYDFDDGYVEDIVKVKKEYDKLRRD